MECRVGHGRKHIVHHISVGGVLIITFVVLYSLGTFKTINPKVKKTLWVVLTVVNYTFSACLVIISVLEFLAGDVLSGFIYLGIAIGPLCYELWCKIRPDHVKRQKK